jgi:hypothetical protein
MREWNPEANFRTLGLFSFLADDASTAALSRQAARESSSNSHDFACVERLKSIVEMFYDTVSFDMETDL